MQRFFLFPDEIMLNILNKADAKTVCSFEQVSQSAKILAEDESLWKIKFKTDFQFNCDDMKELWEEINRRAAYQDLTFKKLYSYFASCELNNIENAAVEHMGKYGVTENHLKWFHTNNELQDGIKFGEIHFSLLQNHLQVLDDINRCEVITPSLHLNI